MSPIFLPLSPRFITFTLTVLAMILFGVWLYFDQRSIVLAVYIAQVFASRWWLDRFRFGPIEWLWRALMYGRAPPFLMTR